MIERFTLLLLYLFFGLLGCGLKEDSQQAPANDCSDLALKIKELEQVLFSSPDSLTPNENIRGQLMADYAAFSNFCHTDTQTPEMLFRRADLLRSAGKFQEAMTQLRDIHDHFPEYDKRAICAFLVGFIAEVELNDREQAKKTYEQVIALHDSTEAAEWARQSLKNLEAMRRLLN
jgi:TolA-binding protein